MRIARIKSLCGRHGALLVILLSSIALCAQNRVLEIVGTVTDPQSKAAPNVSVTLNDPRMDRVGETRTDLNGHFVLHTSGPGTYTLKVNAPGFSDATRTFTAATFDPVTVNMRLGSVAQKQETVAVTADVKTANILFPDPAQRVYIRQEKLDANPGRPGAHFRFPVCPYKQRPAVSKLRSILLPAWRGITVSRSRNTSRSAPTFISDNLSSNAHGNGYADPNIMVPAIIEGVQTDGGAFNVREGNHAESLSAIYQLRSRIEPFVTITGDYRDADVVAGWSPENSNVRSWIAIEAAYGNGFLDRLEHRRQFKLNGLRVWDLGKHNLTLFGIGYFGDSYVPGLVPLSVPQLGDTVDARQRDQTHTGELTADDDWHLTYAQTLQLSGSFRTYNLSLLSNFGDGLIRQSEFRTVTGGNATYVNHISSWLSVLVGIDYQRDAPRNLDLDRYLSTDLAVYGPFEK